MIIDVTTDLGQWIASEGTQFAALAETGTIVFDGEVFENTLHVYDDTVGDWYLFGGHCLPYAMIRADSFGEAYDIYLCEYMGEAESPENEEEAAYGTYTSDGKWYSEASLAYLVSIDLSRVERTAIEMIAD